MLNKRQQTILQYVNERGEATNAELATLIGDCSAMTLWRDLTKLENEGRIVRYRGGAASVGGEEAGQSQEINFMRRARQNVADKEAIAQIAAALILPEHTHFLDAGSTVLTLLKFLRSGNYNFTTSATNIASELAQHPSYDVTMLGGQLNSNTLSCSGPQTERMLREINIDIAVMATSGYAAGSGFTSGRLTESELKRNVIEKAALTIMLFDHAKLTRRHPFTFAALEDIDVLIADRTLSDDFSAACRKNDVQVFSPEDGLSEEERVRVFKGILRKKDPFRT